MSAAQQWTPVFPVPPAAPAPKFVHSHRGAAQERFHFRDAEGATLGYVCTYFKSTGEQIELTLTWCRNADGEFAWRWVQFPALRPLYGLDELAADPARAVLLVFSCQAAAAARELLPIATAVSWPGGVRKIAEVDWSPLRGRVVYVCPDAQRPKSGAAIEKILLGYGCTVHVVDVDRDPLPPGWSLADAHKAQWSEGRAWGWLKERTPLGGAEKKKSAAAVRRRAARCGRAGRRCAGGRLPDHRLARRRAAEDRR